MKFTNTETYNFISALRGMRNPLQSHAKSDSYMNDDIAVIGENDLNLAQRLLVAGTEHSKFMRQIFVSVDITAPIYWWSEMDTYKIGTTANSCSTMHTLHKHSITKDMFETDDDLDINKYGSFGELDVVISYLEGLRLKYIETGDYNYFRELKQLLPSSFLQTRTWTANYAVIRNIYNQRCYHKHKLREWSTDFKNWVHTLPYSKELITYGLV